MTQGELPIDQRIVILEAMRNDPVGWDGVEVRDMLAGWDFVSGFPGDYHWYVVHREKAHWDLDMFVPTARPVSSTVVETAVELVDELRSRSPSE